MSNQVIASDINDFAQLLETHKVIQDAKSLYEASSKLQNSQNVNQWRYECGNLKFSVEGAVAGSIPQPLSLTEIIFNISITGVFQNKENSFINPLIQLNFDIELEGFRDLENKIDNYFASWHLDKHLGGTNRPTYVHPEYHLTFGGNKLEEKGIENFGSTLILSSPRIAYPPMDVILGIDFILHNYFPLEEVSKLLDEPKYKEIVSKAQERLWKPYFLSLSTKWNNTPNITYEQGFEYFDLNPHINQ